jgi:hypothetical protein
MFRKSKYVSVPGVDVMMTIFCDFQPKKCRFIKNQCSDQIFAQFSFVLSQNANFLPFFWRKCFEKSENRSPESDDKKWIALSLTATNLEKTEAKQNKERHSFSILA